MNRDRDDTMSIGAVTNSQKKNTTIPTKNSKMIITISVKIGVNNIRVKVEEYIAHTKNIL